MSSKGQWFLISAIMATGVFLFISGLFNSYFVVDTSETANLNEDFHFRNIKQQFNTTIMLSDCTNMDRNIREFIELSWHRMNSMGYNFYMNYTIRNCGSKIVDYGLLVASDKFVVYESLNPDEVLG